MTDFEWHQLKPGDIIVWAKNNDAHVINGTRQLNSFTTHFTTCINSNNPDEIGVDLTTTDPFWWKRYNGQVPGE